MAGLGLAVCFPLEAVCLPLEAVCIPLEAVELEVGAAKTKCDDDDPDDCGVVDSKAHPRSVVVAVVVAETAKEGHEEVSKNLASNCLKSSKSESQFTSR